MEDSPGLGWNHTGGGGGRGLIWQMATVQEPLILPMVLTGCPLLCGAASQIRACPPTVPGSTAELREFRHFPLSGCYGLSEGIWADARRQDEFFPRREYHAPGTCCMIWSPLFPEVGIANPGFPGSEVCSVFPSFQDYEEKSIFIHFHLKNKERQNMVDCG